MKGPGRLWTVAATFTPIFLRHFVRSEEFHLRQEWRLEVSHVRALDGADRSRHGHRIAVLRDDAARVGRRLAGAEPALEQDARARTRVHAQVETVEVLNWPAEVVGEGDEGC